jgi:hypothetical protein
MDISRRQLTVNQSLVLKALTQDEPQHQSLIGRFQIRIDSPPHQPSQGQNRGQASSKGHNERRDAPIIGDEDAAGEGNAFRVVGMSSRSHAEHRHEGVVGVGAIRAALRLVSC